MTDSRLRRNNMAPYLPFIPLFFCFIVVPLATLITDEMLPDLSNWQREFVDSAILSGGAIAAIIAMIFLARATFARRLKGFGLDVITIHKDFFVGAVNLLAIWPVVMVVIILTMYFGEQIWGPDWQMQRHRELETIIAYPQLPVRLLVIFTAAVIAPVFEELLFRGMIQTIIRSYIVRPWVSIIVSSLLFITVHENREHWPALFVLSMCMGYAYEKSGSLFRPIFIHAFFNTAMVVGILYQ